MGNFAAALSTREVLEEEAYTFKPNVASIHGPRAASAPRDAGSSDKPFTLAAPAKGFAEAVSRLQDAAKKRSQKFEESLRREVIGSDAMFPSKRGASVETHSTVPHGPQLRTNARMANRRPPLLYVDVDMGLGKVGRIGVHEGDEAQSLAQNFARNDEESASLRVVAILSNDYLGLHLHLLLPMQRIRMGQ